MSRLRAVTAIVVAADSPLGRLVGAIEQLSTHLPTPEQPGTCLFCSMRAWPCASFDAAVRHLQTSGLPIGYLIPLDLHPELWPAP